jgi:hypothetical protein
MNMIPADLHSAVLDAHPVEGLLDVLVCPLGRPLQGEAVLDPLDGPLDGRRDALDAPLDGVPEEGDVALPAGSPLDRLPGETLLGAGGHEVEGGEPGDASGAHAEDLGPGGGGDADDHVGGRREDWCCGLFSGSSARKPAMVYRPRLFKLEGVGLQGQCCWMKSGW